MNSKKREDTSERVLFEIFGCKIKVSRWNKSAKILTAISGAVAIAGSLMTIFMSITIPGLTPIATGIFFWCFGIKQLNDYLDTRNKKLLYIGLAMGVVFAVDLYIGIMQIVNASVK